MIRKGLRAAVLGTMWGLCLAPVLAQIAPLSSDIVNLNGTSFQATVAPFGTITLVNVTVDSSSAGGDQIEIIAGDDGASAVVEQASACSNKLKHVPRSGKIYRG
jgi:hypothetical protein